VEIMSGGAAMTETTAKQSAQRPRVVPDQRPTERYRTPRRVPHLTPEERVARGKAARQEVPRSSHAVFEPSTHRPDPLGLLEGQAVTRVPSLVPIRYGRMLSSPFAFYRGAALIMASDLAGTPTSGLRVQVCGDAHLSNFGLFASPERQVVFDLNDFDETLPGPWEWDVKRLAASLEIAGRANEFDAAECQKVVLSAVREYRLAMASFAGMGNLEVWYTEYPAAERLAELSKAQRAEMTKATTKIVAKAKTRDHLQAFSKLITTVNGEPRFVSNPPLLVPAEELVEPGTDMEALHEQIRGSLRSYRTTLSTERRHLLETYRFVQLARKVVGVGSVGTRAWVALFLGRDDADPLLLQVKEAQPSVLEGFVGRSEYTNSGHRVVAGQRLMQTTSDIFLGWQRVQGIDGATRDFYMRQLHDWKGSIEIEQMSPIGMEVYARRCGWTLAKAHARSGDRMAIAAYLGTSDSFDRALGTFSVAYADQNERDHAALAAAVAEGRVKAETDI
jgi:uncharacterized protein (DUF2252 family)